jgi:DNA-binding IclR family transcriptional regulator
MLPQPSGTSRRKCMNPIQFDLDVLRNRAEQWRCEAALVTLEGERAFCLAQAEECEQRVRQSLTVSALRDGARHTHSK